MKENSDPRRVWWKARAERDNQIFAFLVKMPCGCLKDSLIDQDSGDLEAEALQDARGTGRYSDERASIYRLAGNSMAWG